MSLRLLNENDYMINFDSMIDTPNKTMHVIKQGEIASNCFAIEVAL